MFMEIAHSVAKRSTCSRLSVGAVLVRNNNIVSIGYNGVPSGAPHCAGNDCPGRRVCHLTTHAEVNALTRLAHNPDNEGQLQLYVTHSPCPHCMDAIEQDGRVGAVYFGSLYRLSEHLSNRKVVVFSVTPNGYVMEWDTKELVNED